MNSHKHSSGSTGFGWVRSLLTFRHRNPVARFVSSLVAFAMALLLVVGTGAAYAGDTTPTPTDPTATTTPDPTVTSTPPADPVTTPDPSTPTAPTTNSSTPSTSTGTSSPTTPTTTTTTTTTTKKSNTQTTMSALAVVPNVVGVATCEPGTGTLVPSSPLAEAFQIDGDPCAEGGLDFESASGATHDDAFNSKTDDAFGSGSSESKDPSGWSLTGPQPTGKADIGTVWAYSQTSGGDVYAYFGFTNDSTSGGTQDYSLEYNQHDPTAGGLPVRTPGDLLFHFDSTGSNALDYVASYIYRLTSDPLYSAASCQSISSSSPAAGWCTKTLPSGAWTAQASSTGQFVEGAIDITQMFGAGTCSGTFGTTFMRSAPGSYFTSELKDYVAPLETRTPSTCGKIIINKQDENGNYLPGATFSVSPNPIPGVPNATPYSITDNDSKDKNPADGIIEISPVDPGDSYTVTETGPPTGYLLDNPLGTSTNPQTVGVSQTKTFNFVDHRIWKGLTATKTANTTYRAQYGWSINKEISPNGTDGWTTDTTNLSPLIKKVSAGSADTLFYRVTVTEGARTTSLYKVSGNISVSNPSDNVGSMDATVTDELSGATCLVDGAASKSITVTKGATVDVPYVCSFASTPTATQLAGTNTGHVTWDRSTYPQVVGDLTDVGGTTRSVDPTAAYDFANATVTEVDKTVTVTDSPLTISPAWTITWTAQGVTDSRSYNHDVTVAGGDCSAVFANTATITGNTSGVLGSDSAYGQVCEAANLTVSKNKTVSMTRTYLWQIHKTRTSAASINSGDSANYSVTVDRAAGAGYQDSGWAMTGTITVTNPNDWESVAMSSLVDHYSGDNDATNSCSIVHSRVAGTTTWGPVDLSLDPSQVMEYQYTCTFTTQPTYDGTNTATATWDAATAHTAADSGSTDTTSQGTASVTSSEWALNSTPVNKVITVTDSAYTGGTGTGGHTLGTLDWDNAPHTYTYSITWTAAAGTCETKPNTATIVETDQTSSAEVQVCNSVGLSVSKTAAGHFDRTYHWSLAKVVSADPASPTSGWTNADSWTGPSYSHLFGYLVTLSQEPWTDSNFTITGAITLTNHNTDQAIPAISSTITDAPDVGAAATCVVDGGPDNGASLVGYTTPAIASGDSLTIDYLCSVADLTPAQYTGGENSVSATNASNSPATAPVTFTKAGEIDKSVTVYDDKVTLSTPDVLGTETYDESVPNRTYSYTYTLEHTATATQCEDFTNHASVFANTEALAVLTGLPLATADATATVCPQAGTWTVAKSVAEPATVAVGTTLHYTLTATKTGGVNPTNVDVVDDLTAIAPYITGAPVVTTVGADTSYSGTKLTWHIGELTGEQTLQFEVTLKGDAYSADLPNLVTSVGSQNCPDAQSATAACKTDNGTPAPPIVSPPIVSPPKQPHHPSVLPNTGGPDGLWLAGGLALVLAGGVLVMGDRRRRRRS